MPGGRRPRVVVVGGGITGLACAWLLRDRADVRLLEAGGRLGGKIRTSTRWGVPVEAGPDLFLARVPWAVELCREAGLGDDLVAPATGRAFVWSGGRLHPVPPGLVLGVPSDLPSVVRSGLVSPAGLGRAALDLVLPRRKLPPDPTVADVIGGRLGREVLERIVEPLLGGIHAGRADRLSLRAVAPEVASVAERHRSLVIGMRRRPPSPGGPVFQSVRGGLGRLVERLSADLGPRVETGTSVEALRPRPEGGLIVDAGGRSAEADSVVVTVPAFAAEPLLRASSPGSASELRSVRYAPVVTVTLAYDPSAVEHPLDGSGFLVPRVEGTLVTACTFLTSKWPDLGASGKVLLRASCGRVDDGRALELDDAELTGAVHAELNAALGLRHRPSESIVTRWPRALPQYEAGHAERMSRARSALASDLPGTHLAGAAYGGVGIAACIRQAREAAGACLGSADSGRPSSIAR